MTLDEVIAVYKEAKEIDEDVARVHTGDPSLYGAINEQMEGLEEMGVEYDVVPGVSSFQAAAAALKTELTMPEISQAVVLTRTSGRTPMPEGQELEKMAQNQATLCIFLSTHKIKEVPDTLIPYYGADCPVAVVYKASWPDQIIVQGTLSTIANKTVSAGIKKTALIMVGHAIGARGTTSKLYDKNFSHEFRKATK
jgi:precorrin-4/cobalt-precorrin-4 C11-methyltransferase